MNNYVTTATVHRSLWGVHSYVHINLCLSLMAAQLLFVLRWDKEGSQVEENGMHGRSVRTYPAIIGIQRYGS